MLFGPSEHPKYAHNSPFAELESNKSPCISFLPFVNRVLGYLFVLVNNELTVKTEAYLYDERSLLAESGGALGLFLGFSFYTLWEIFEPIVNSLKKAINTR